MKTKVQKVESLYLRLISGGASVEEVRELESLAHDLAGHSRVHGHLAFGAAARTLHVALHCGEPRDVHAAVDVLKRHAPLAEAA